MEREMALHWDTISLPTLIVAITTVTGVAFFLKASFAKGQVDSYKQAAEGYKMLAEAKSVEVVELKSRVLSLETDQKEARKEREEHLKIIIGLEKQIAELKDQISSVQMKRRLEDDRK